VIIPTCNRNELLGKCLDRLMPGTQTLAAAAYEVIVSDDGAGEGAETFCRQRYPWVRYVRGPRRGPAANRNNGASIAAGDWLVFTDDDCLPDAGWLHAYVCAIDAYPDCKAFEGAIWPDDEELLKKDMAECPVNTKGGFFWSANIMVDKIIFNQVGKFDEVYQIAANEDQELFKRILQKTAVPFIKTSVIEHPVRIGSVKKKIIKSNQYVRNWLIFRCRSGYSYFDSLTYVLFSELKGATIALRLKHFKRFILHLYSICYWIFLSPIIYFKYWVTVK